MDTIQDSIQCFQDEMERVGYSIKCRKIASAALARLVDYHHENNSSHFNLQIAHSYLNDIQEKLNNDAMGQYLANEHTWYIRKYIDFCHTGIINADRYALPKLPFPEVFAVVINNYTSEVSHTDQQRKSRAWAPKRYAFWLSNHGVSSFNEIKVTDLRLFIMEDSSNLKSKTLPTFRSELRRFHIWLHDHGYIEHTFEEFFDFKASIENKIHPAAPPDDVAKVLSQIDRTTDMGKREYAAIMLGVSLGLRACDVKHMKLTDIDWRRGEICIAQHKTGKPLALPLTTDVGEALKDYILNARPQLDDQHVFLRHQSPIGPLKSSSSFGGSYTKYMRMAGLDGAGGFYQLRRAKGKNLVTSGTPVTTVSQVLGHTNISNTKQYIALDTQSLKVCALDFKGVEPRGWNS
jgi:integrase